MSRAFLLLAALVIVGTLAYVVAPLFGPTINEGAIVSSLSRASIAFVGLPFFLLQSLCATNHFDKRTKTRVDSLFALGGLAAILTPVLLLGRLYPAAGIAALTSWLFLYFGMRLWSRAQPTPRQRIIAEGERILAEETDPKEKQKFRWALERFKKP